MPRDEDWRQGGPAYLLTQRPASLVRGEGPAPALAPTPTPSIVPLPTLAHTLPTRPCPTQPCPASIDTAVLEQGWATIRILGMLVFLGTSQKHSASGRFDFNCSLQAPMRPTPTTVPLLCLDLNPHGLMTVFIFHQLVEPTLKIIWRALFSPSVPRRQFSLAMRPLKKKP